MNSEWKAFLATQSAGFLDNDNDEIGFDNALTFSDCVLCDLSHLGLIAVQGEDAQNFLQGQLTNDARKITEGNSQLSGFCNPKGRMLANFRIFRRLNTIYLQLPMTLKESVLKRLKMFVLRTKVTLEDASDDLIRVGFVGDCTHALLGERLAKLPTTHDDVVHQDGLTLIRIAGPHPRFEIIGPITAVQPLWQSLTGQATPVNADFWAWLDIQAGMPTIYQQTVGAFVPQMANMQLVNGVSFTKGCYTGQEIVARMQYLGKLKRRMYLAHVDADQIPQPGDELFSQSSASGQGTGKIVDARAAPGGGYDLLAVVEISSTENDQVLLGQGGPKLRFKDLPYGFSSTQAEP